MFDARLRQAIDPALAGIASGIAKSGVSANIITLSSIPVALVAALAIHQHAYLTALLLIAINRLLDGLDGMVARINGPTANGAYLDILADFLFYVSVPLAFGLAVSANLEPALLLISAFTLTGVSFLAFASVAANSNIDESVHGPKGFLYTTGLMEGGETIAFFVAFCLFPLAFAMLAYVFAALCIVTVLQRSLLAWQTFK